MRHTAVPVLAKVSSVAQRFTIDDVKAKTVITALPTVTPAEREIGVCFESGGAAGVDKRRAGLAASSMSWPPQVEGSVNERIDGSC